MEDLPPPGIGERLQYEAGTDAFTLVRVSRGCCCLYQPCFFSRRFIGSDCGSVHKGPELAAIYIDVIAENSCESMNPGYTGAAIRTLPTSFRIFNGFPCLAGVIATLRR